MTGQLLCVISLLSVLLKICQGRNWGTVSLNSRATCNKVTRNKHMSEGDLYAVRPYERRLSVWYKQMPVQCETKLDYVDRNIRVDIARWRCDRDISGNVSVVVYGGCGLRSELFRLNCSVDIPPSHSFYSYSSCVTVYHYRGRERWSYVFELHVYADKEVLAFSAEGISVAFVGSLVALMIVMKIACVITGYEDSIPDFNKLTSASSQDGPAIVRVMQPDSDCATDRGIADDDSSTPSDLSPTLVQMLSSSPRPSVIHSFSSDFLDVPGPRRFSGFRTASIFGKS